MNFFSYSSAAQRYAKGRPYFHPLVIEKIPATTGIPRFQHGIDVGCGTGLSTQALTAIAHRVTGTDFSQEMLELAPRTEGISYTCCPAEALPFSDASFDLMTVALAFHWLDRPKFLSEARRVLQDRSWLVIYQNGFSGSMIGKPAYKQWNDQRYLSRYPTPPRNHAAFTSNDAEAAGFEFVTSENYSNEVQFTIEELACYLSTQSNMIAAIESGQESATAAMEWLSAELRPLFSQKQEAFPFSGSIWFLRKL